MALDKGRVQVLHGLLNAQSLIFEISTGEEKWRCFNINIIIDLLRYYHEMNVKDGLCKC